jgi:chromosome segregation ATPase
MDNMQEKFITNYIKRQEEFLHDMIRSRIEAEVNASIRAEYIENLEKKVKNSELTEQAVSELKKVLSEKNDLQQETNNLKSDLSIVESQKNTLKNDIETYKNNYDCVMKELETFKIKYEDILVENNSNKETMKDMQFTIDTLFTENQQLIAKHKEYVDMLQKAKKKIPAKKSTDWIDGSEPN